jgi:hypothetical protein
MSIDKDLKVRMPVWGNRWEEPEELRGHLEDVTGAGARLVLDQAVFYDGLAWGRPFIPDAGYSFIPCLEVTPESYLEGGDTVRYPRVRLKKDQFVTTERESATISMSDSGMSPRVNTPARSVLTIPTGSKSAESLSR